MTDRTGDPSDTDGDGLDSLDAECARLRRDVEDALRGRRLVSRSLVLERRRRFIERIERVEDLAAANDPAAARDELAEARRMARLVIEAAGELPWDEATVRTGGWTPLRNVGTVARKELVVLLQGTQGWVLLALFLLTFGLGLEAALGQSTAAGVPGSVALVWSYAHSIDFISVPLAGLLVGHALINEERTARTMHFLGSKPISRAGIAAGKWSGMAGALAVLVGVSALIVGTVAYAATRRLGDPGTVLGYVLATYLLALSFATLALLASALIDRTAGALIAGFGAYVVVGPVWQNVFLVRSLENVASGVPVAGLITYLATPFTAWWNWTSELLGPRSEVLGLPVGEPWHAALVTAVERGTLDGLPFYAQQWFYVLVLVAWIALGLAATIRVMQRRDLA